jgi:hypothetical protein
MYSKDTHHLDFTHVAIEDRNQVAMGIEPHMRTLMEYNEESDTYDYDYSSTLNPYGPEDTSWGVV